jgi:hypothetical protein
MPEQVIVNHPGNQINKKNWNMFSRCFHFESLMQRTENPFALSPLPLP